MSLHLYRRAGHVFLAVSFLIVIAALVTARPQWDRYRLASEKMDASRDAILSAKDLLSSLKDAETGQRGYLLTKDASYLAPYEAARTDVPKALGRLHDLQDGSDALRKLVDRLTPAVNDVLTDLAHTIAVANQQGTSAAMAAVRSGRGKDAMDRIRFFVTQIDQEERDSIRRWTSDAEMSGRRALAVASGGATLLFVFLFMSTIAARHAQAREQDIARREQHAVEALSDSENHFKIVSDFVPVLIWEAGVDRRRVFFNRRWLEFTGRTLEQEQGEGWIESIHPDDVALWRDGFRQAFEAKREFQLEYRLRRHDGQYRWILARGRPRFDLQGTFQGYIGACIDIHDRKMLENELEQRVEERTEELRYKERELMQSRKLEAIGRLAGGVAHDFNNMLTGIYGVAEEVHAQLEPSSGHRGDLSEIMKAARRAASLTKQLLAFGRRQVAAPQVMNLNASLLEMISMLKRLIGEDIRLETSLADDLGAVRIDPGQVEQIVINLALNARDAMPQGGRIMIETANVDLDEQYQKKHFDVAPGPYVLLAISDTGMGMDEDTQRHAFEPFFSTKDRDKGTGMGLATVYGIVKQNNGDIFLYSAKGSGTTFKIYLPRVQEVPTRAAPAEKALRKPVLGRETVLVVEDEELVRRVAVRALRTSGYQVLEAANGKEALEISASFERPIDLLLTDVIMPGLNGRQLAEILAPMRPAMKVLYTSGYTENIIVQRGMLKPGIAFIEKSFTSETLLAKVRSVLDGTSEPA